MIGAINVALHQAFYSQTQHRQPQTNRAPGLPTTTQSRLSPPSIMSRVPSYKFDASANDLPRRLRPVGVSSSFVHTSVTDPSSPRTIGGHPMPPLNRKNLRAPRNPMNLVCTRTYTDVTMMKGVKSLSCDLLRRRR